MMTVRSLLRPPTPGRSNKNGTGGQADPALNLYGTHLNVTGDFAVTTHLTDQGDGTATLQLYSKPPVIADEFRVEPAASP